MDTKRRAKERLLEFSKELADLLDKYGVVMSPDLDNGRLESLDFWISDDGEKQLAPYASSTTFLEVFVPSGDEISSQEVRRTVQREEEKEQLK